ncbi:MAG: hypothetical protein AB2813_03600 [Candidatus Sedimenticola endophacoides]
MQETKYQLVLSGRLREGVEPGQAAAALVRLFRMPEQERWQPCWRVGARVR